MSFATYVGPKVTKRRPFGAGVNSTISGNTKTYTPSLILTGITIIDETQADDDDVKHPLELCRSGRRAIFFKFLLDYQSINQ